MSDPPTENNQEVALRCWKVWGGNGHVQSRIAIPGMTGAVCSIPCQAREGGDLYYLSACGSGVQARLCLADVVGHGAGVAQFSAWLEDVFAAHIHRGSPAGVLRDVNRRASDRGLEVVSTALCLSYNSTNGKLGCTYAGHPHILLLRRGSADWNPLYEDVPDSTDIRNVPLGVSDKSRFDVHRTILYPGDRLFLYTDGMPEAASPAGEPFKQRMEEVLKQERNGSPEAIVDTLLSCMRSHVGRASFDHDDVTFMVLEASPYLAGNRWYHFLRNNTPFFGASATNRVDVTPGG